MRVSKGDYAVTIYDDDGSSLTIDWSFDGLYFKYKNGPYITLSLGEKTKENQIYMINTPDIIEVFKKMCFFGFKNLKGYSDNSKNAVYEVLKFVDYFV